MFLKSQKLFIIVTAVVVCGVTSSCTYIEIIAFSLGEMVSYHTQYLYTRDENSVGWKDVTYQETFRGEAIWKGYKRGEIYQLKRNIFYAQFHENYLCPPWAEPGAPKIKATLFAKLFSDPTHYINSIPKSIKAFNADPAKWPSIKGVIPQGTKLMMRRVIFQSLCPHDVFHYVALFIDGPFAGKKKLT